MWNVFGHDRHVNHDWHVEPSSSGSTIRVVPRVLMKNPAPPSQRMVVSPEALNASAPKGCVFGAFAWYFFSFGVATGGCAVDEDGEDCCACPSRGIIEAAAARVPEIRNLRRLRSRFSR